MRYSPSLGLKWTFSGGTSVSNDFDIGDPSLAPVKAVLSPMSLLGAMFKLCFVVDCSKKAS